MDGVGRTVQTHISNDEKLADVHSLQVATPALTCALHSGHSPHAKNRPISLSCHLNPLNPAPAVRIATSADLSFVNHLQKRFASCLGFLPLQALEWYIAAGQVKLINENDAAAGYLLGRTHLKCMPVVRPLIQTAICMDAQRRDHGRALIETAAVEAAADGQSILQAWCRVDLEANHFWRSCGFVAVATRRPKTARGLPLILWRRPLNDLGRQRLLLIPKFAGYRSRCDDPRRLITPADAGRYLHSTAA